jgi:predicted kinase
MMGPVLVIMSGLPATGKTALARAQAREIGAVHLRLDVIEQAVVHAGAGDHPLGPVGYTIAYALAEDLLRQRFTVIADCVNPLAATRQDWRDVATAATVDHLDVEVVCSEPAEHERRADTRTGDIPGLTLPTWADISRREYEPWDRDHLVIDTARRDVAGCVAECVAQLRSAIPPGGR